MESAKKSIRRQVAESNDAYKAERERWKKAISSRVFARDSLEAYERELELKNKLFAEIAELNQDLAGTSGEETSALQSAISIRSQIIEGLSGCEISKR